MVLLALIFWCGVAPDNSSTLVDKPKGKVKELTSILDK